MIAGAFVDSAHGGPDLLRTIIAATERITEVRRDSEPMAALERRAATASPRGELFETNLGRRGLVNVIAECKRRSPSKGVLAADYDPVSIAKRYEAGGASAISVLTEPTFFDGSLEHLRAVRDAVALPVLRKDFIVDEYQIAESRVLGADAILLIAAALEDEQMAALERCAHEYGMDVLVEVHDADELARALPLATKLIGINNRNLRNFSVTLDTTFNLLPRVPGDRLVVTESGIVTQRDVALMRAKGVNAFLVGEAFMRAADPGAALTALFG